ncbi:MAG: prepilin-type N-terminal cleavage/methylation domain-containing protein [Verrucomicrobiota bacterium]
MKTNTRAGFTLIEIMVVVAIIGLIAGIAIPNMADAIKNLVKRCAAPTARTLTAPNSVGLWTLSNRRLPRPPTTTCSELTATSNTSPTARRTATTRSMPSMKSAHAMRTVMKTDFWSDHRLVLGEFFQAG